MDDKAFVPEVNCGPNILSSERVIDVRYLDGVPKDETMTLDGIPEYPAFRKITLEDRTSVKEMLARYPTEVSERIFGSVFMKSVLRRSPYAWGRKQATQPSATSDSRYTSLSLPQTHAPPSQCDSSGSVDAPAGTLSAGLDARRTTPSR